MSFYTIFRYDIKRYIDKERPGMGLNGILWLYIIIINIIAYILMGMDKSKSRKGMWRISERTLFVMAFVGGSLGILGGMYAFHHKTKHTKFKWGIPIIIVMQAILSFWIWRNVA